LKNAPQLLADNVMASISVPTFTEVLKAFPNQKDKIAYYRTWFLTVGDAVKDDQMHPCTAVTDSNFKEFVKRVEEFGLIFSKSCRLVVLEAHCSNLEGKSNGKSLKEACDKIERMVVVPPVEAPPVVSTATDPTPQPVEITSIEQLMSASNPSRIQDLPIEVVTVLTAENVAKISNIYDIADSQMAVLSSKLVSGTHAAGAFTADDMKKVSISAYGQMTRNFVDALPVPALAGITEADMLKAIPASSLKGLTKAQAEGIPAAAYAKLTKAQCQVIGIDHDNDPENNPVPHIAKQTIEDPAAKNALEERSDSNQVRAAWTVLIAAALSIAAFSI